MSEMMISDLPVAVALSPTDKFEIEQASQVESTHLTVAALLSHIDTTLLTTLKGDIDALEIAIGGSSVSLAVVEARVTVTESDVVALEAALAAEITNRQAGDAAIVATISTFNTALTNETNARIAADNAIGTRITGVEDDVTVLEAAIGSKAPLVHTHVIADVTGLVTALAGKEPANANIQGHIAATNNPHGVNKTQVGLGNVDNTADVNKPVSTAQQEALDGKANTVHTHAISQVTGLQTALDAKAGTVHTHVINDVTGLQTALNNKAPLNHTHVIADTTGLQAALDAKDVAMAALASNLAAEATARLAGDAEVVAARGPFADLDARLDNLAVSAGAITSVFGRTGDVVGAHGDYNFADLGITPTTLAGYGITDAAALSHVHSAADITSGVLAIARGGTGGEGFRYIASGIKPTGVPVGTRWLNVNTGREYTLHQDADEIVWVQWSGGQPIQGTDSMGGGDAEWGSIGGDIADQADLQAVLATYALASALSGYALVSHTHTIAQVTGLQTALDAKAAISGQTFTGAVAATSLSDSAGNVRNLLSSTANATTTLGSTHLNKVVEKSNTTAYTYTIAPGLGVQGDVITIINSGTAGDVTVARGSGVALYRNGTDANLTVSPGSMVTLYRTATSDRWIG